MLPIGLSDVPGEAMVKLYCPKCMDVYTPKSSRLVNTYITNEGMSCRIWFTFKILLKLIPSIRLCVFVTLKVNRICITWTKCGYLYKLMYASRIKPYYTKSCLIIIFSLCVPLTKRLLVLQLCHLPFSKQISAPKGA